MEENVRELNEIGVSMSDTRNLACMHRQVAQAVILIRQTIFRKKFDDLLHEYEQGEFERCQRRIKYLEEDREALRTECQRLTALNRACT